MITTTTLNAIRAATPEDRAAARAAQEVQLRKMLTEGF